VKKSAVLTGVSIVASVIIWDAVLFANGYSVFPPPHGPLILLFVLALLFLASGGAALVAVIAIFRKRFQLAVGLVVVVCLSWALSPRFFAPSSFLFGLAARVRSSTSPAEIESAAQLCTSLLPQGGYIHGPKKSGPDRNPEEEQETRRRWDALSRYGFVHLGDDRCLVFVQPPDVTFEWGGSVLGHWGIRVLGSRHDAAPEYYLDSLRYSDKTLLFVDH
jgi:hypothetical protein